MNTTASRQTYDPRNESPRRKWEQRWAKLTARLYDSRTEQDERDRLEFAVAEEVRKHSAKWWPATLPARPHDLPDDSIIMRAIGKTKRSRRGAIPKTDQAVLELFATWRAAVEVAEQESLGRLLVVLWVRDIYARLGVPMVAEVDRLLADGWGIEQALEAPERGYEREAWALERIQDFDLCPVYLRTGEDPMGWAIGGDDDDARSFADG